MVRSLGGGILVNAVGPGFTGTGFSNHPGTQTVTEGTDAGGCQPPAAA